MSLAHAPERYHTTSGASATSLPSVTSALQICFCFIFSDSSHLYIKSCITQALFLSLLHTVARDWNNTNRYCYPLTARCGTATCQHYLFLEYIVYTQVQVEHRTTMGLSLLHIVEHRNRHGSNASHSAYTDQILLPPHSEVWNSNLSSLILFLKYIVYTQGQVEHRTTKSRIVLHELVIVCHKRVSWETCVGREAT